MKPIKSLVIAKMTEAKAIHLADTTCYNYHKTTLDNKLANVNKLVKSLFLKDDSLLSICVVTGKIGRSGHSATDLHLFDVRNVEGLLSWENTSGRRFYFIHRNFECVK